MNLTFNITMKPRMVSFLDRMVDETGCYTRSEYLRDLVRRDADSRRIDLEAHPRKHPKPKPKPKPKSTKKKRKKKRAA